MPAQPQGDLPVPPKLAKMMRRPRWDRGHQPVEVMLGPGISCYMCTMIIATMSTGCFAGYGLPRDVNEELAQKGDASWNIKHQNQYRILLLSTSLLIKVQVNQSAGNVVINTDLMIEVNPTKRRDQSQSFQNPDQMDNRNPPPSGQIQNLTYTVKPELWR